MKLREIEANVKINDEKGNVLSIINAKGSYNEPESISEFMAMNLDNETKMRVILYGLNTFHQAKIRLENNFGSAAKKLVDCGLFKTVKEAFEHLVRIKNAQESAKN